MERTAKLLGVHLALLALLGLLCWYGCPFARLLGISCPGCGLTRAWLCFLQGRWQQAMAYHALFLPAPPFLLWVIHRNAVRQFPARPLLDAAAAIYGALLVGYHLARAGLLQ